MTATRHLKFNSLQIAIYHQHIVRRGRDRFYHITEVKFLCTFSFSPFGHASLALLQFYISVERSIEVYLVFKNVGIEIASLFVGQLLNQLVENAFVPLQFAIFQFAFQHLFPHRTVATLNFAQRLTDFRLRVS